MEISKSVPNSNASMRYSYNFLCCVLLLKKINATKKSQEIFLTFQAKMGRWCNVIEF